MSTWATSAATPQGRLPVTDLRENIRRFRFNGRRVELPTTTHSESLQPIKDVERLAQMCCLRCWIHTLGEEEEREKRV